MNCSDANRNDDNGKNDTKARQSTELAPQTKANNTGGAGKIKSEQKSVKCYNCGQRGHISTKCPTSAALFCKLE